MKRYIIYIGLLIGILTACADDELGKFEGVSDKEVWATLSFGHQSFEKIDISTRATMSEEAESRVENLYVYIFDKNGKRLYSHYYDNNNRRETLPPDVGNYWTVKNRTTVNQNNTQGEIRIKAPVMTGGSIYVIANLNADQLNISADQLNTIDTLEELQQLTITLNQEITSRTGYFLMTGSESGINVSSTGKITKNNGDVKISLLRLDAKITVNVKIGQSGIANQEMKNFVPESWQVMRLPKGTRLLDADDDADNLGYFNSPVVHFESDINGVKSFSFYQLENMEDVTGATLTYNDRDLRNKNVNGSYNTANGLWKYASEDATYMIIKGKVQMKVNTNVVTDMQYLEADVVYYIHLGNFGNSKQGGSYNDFTVRRNTHYTYNITIKGVNSIEVEVTDNVENQSGATGHVYKSKEEVYTFDAHYGQKVFRIDASAVVPEKVTWYVKTPFGREGTPDMESGTQIPDLDYKWVKFLLNKKEYNGVYSSNNRWYPGDNGEALEEGEELMDVVRFTQFIKEEKIKLDAAYGDTKPTASAFKKDNNGVYCIYVTAFVDEYYYEADPLNSNNKPQDLWKLFVNQPNRIMHILSDTKKSNDGASSLTSSILTIRQRSIQTPYNLTKANLTSAFGCETVDETREDNLTFYEDDSKYTTKDFGNKSTKNGLYNTACLWNLFNGSTVKIGSNRERWDTYLDYEIPNKATGMNHFMLSGQKCMRYAPMSRNRDNNGNGYIDPEEVRWYIAPLEQLYALYAGDLGLESEAQLYPTSLSTLENKKVNDRWQWRNHIVCSNQTTITVNSQYKNKVWPEMLWAEEGVSISGYGKDKDWSKYAPYSIRCIRNLGMDDASVSTIANVEKNIPTPMISVSSSSDGKVYKFDLSNMNERSARYYTSQELVPGNENNETSRTYYGFETYHEFTTSFKFTFNYSNLKIELENGKSPSPEGYRVPNVREAALMSLYCPSDWWGNNKILSCSYYTHGEYGTGYDNDTYTWVFMNKYITISETPNCLRCVKDWNPTTN